MSFSYSGIIGYKKNVTLPSVDTWGTNMNILRDPPKSIMTRRKDKVGETSSITTMIDESGSRSCEAISMYTRGVNPSVSVDYGNVGNNGGQRVNSGFTNTGLGKSQAYLPYRIMRYGNFRPPVKSPIENLPLSRQPRVNTKAFSNKGFVDFTKKLRCPGGNYKEILKSKLKTCIRPTAVYNISHQAIEPFEVKYVIKNPTLIDSQAGKTGVRTRDLTMLNNIEPKSSITNERVQAENVYANKSTNKNSNNNKSRLKTDIYIQDALHSNVISNKSTNKHTNKNSELKTDRYIQNVVYNDVVSNKSKSSNVTSIEDLIGFNVNEHTKDAVNIAYTPLKTGNTTDGQIHNHEDLHLDRRVLQAEAITNKRENIYKRQEIQYQSEQKHNRPIASATSNFGINNKQSNKDLNSRDYKLKPTINAGEFSGRAQIPGQKQHNEVKLRTSNKYNMNKQIQQMKADRG